MVKLEIASSPISQETSARICKHMNEDHAVSVYAMAKATVKLPGRGWKITEAILKKVDLTGCSIQVIMCRGDMCQAQKMTYRFEPPLRDSSQVRSRLVDIHQRECNPRSYFKNPLVLSIMIVYALLAWTTLAMGPALVTKTIKEHDVLNGMISQYFGSTEAFSKMIEYAFYLTFVGHSVLAFYVAYNSFMTLKLPIRSSMAWAAAVSAAGYPLVQEFRELLEVDRKCKSLKKEKSS